MPSPPILVALALLTTSPSTEDEIGSLYAEGRTLSERGDNERAAEAFERLYGLVPEAAENRPLRETAALNVMTEWLRAYENTASKERGFEYLGRASAFRDLYAAEFEAAYGENRAIIPELIWEFEKLDSLLREAHEATVRVCLQPCLDPCLQPISPNERGCGGRSNDPVMLTALLPLGLRRRRDVFDRISDALPADVVAKLRAKLSDGD